jgi:hypothetical protein
VRHHRENLYSSTLPEDKEGLVLNPIQQYLRAVGLGYCEFVIEKETTDFVIIRITKPSEYFKGIPKRHLRGWNG